MKEIISKTLVITAVLLIVGCTGQQTQSTAGITVKNELSSEIMQPGGSVLVRTSINNFFDNELVDATATLVRSFGQLGVDGMKKDVGTVQANPNATARAQWTLDVKQSAASGTEFVNRVRLCFKYNQTAWHELSMINSFDVESSVNTDSQSGPLKISFSGLEVPYIYNEQVKSTVPISVSIKNNYAGYVGKIDMSKDDVPNLTYVEMRIYDYAGGCSSEYYQKVKICQDAGETREFECNELGGLLNGSPCRGLINEDTNLEITKSLTNPACTGGKTSGCFVCDNGQWDANENYFRCYAHNLSVFGDETFIGTKLNITQLFTEELIENVEVMVSFDYCIESEDFTLTVFTPGGR